MFACVVGCGLALASAESFAAQQEQPKMPYWQDLQTVSVNREAPRTSFMTYDDREAALSGKYENSRFDRLLNGTWKFLYSDSHRRLPADVTSATADLAGWCDIQVPGNWEVQGHGVAIYTNQWFEFKASDPQPPLLPDELSKKATFLPPISKSRNHNSRGASALRICGPLNGSVVDT